jgi:hypothetical protein
MPSKILTAVPATRLPAEPMKPVIDPAAWTGKQLAQESGWQFKLTDVEITEIDQAVASVKDHGLDIKDITLADFPLPTLDAKLAEIKTQVLEGRGVALLRGIPVHRYDIAESAAAYWGIGLRIGNPVS